MRVSVFPFVLVLSTLGIVTGSAQSLADVAKQESERRQTVKDGGKSYTNEDLKPVKVPANSGGSDAADTVGSADPPDPAAPKPNAATGGANTDTAARREAVFDRRGRAVRSEGAGIWSGRIAALREQLERDETFLAALQSRIDALTADYVNRDDPAQRGQIAADRQKALSELDRIRKAIEQDKRAIPELEEDARRAGVPPGWLR